MITVNCDLCESNDYTIIHEIDVTEQNFRHFRYSRNIPQRDIMTGTFSVVECNKCKLKYTNPRFNTEELNLVYSSDKVVGGNWRNFPYLFNSKMPDVFLDAAKSKSYQSSFYQWKFDIIEKFKSKDSGKRLLDIGCGDGKFVYDAITQGYDAIGIDLSPDRISKGKELYNLNDAQLICQNIDDFSENQTFDIIVMWDIIEHVESPSSVLKSIRKISHENTKIFILTMSVDSLTYRVFGDEWNYMNPTQHLHYFSHETMRKMLEKEGFTLESVEMDETKNKNIFHLAAKIVMGRINHLFFRMYTQRLFYRYLFKLFAWKISEERMISRIENLYPGKKYTGRFKDNFVFVAGVNRE